MTRSELLAINDNPIICEETEHQEWLDDNFPLDNPPVYNYELDEDYAELEF